MKCIQLSHTIPDGPIHCRVTYMMYYLEAIRAILKIFEMVDEIRPLFGFKPFTE